MAPVAGSVSPRLWKMTVPCEYAVNAAERDKTQIKILIVPFLHVRFIKAGANTQSRENDRSKNAKKLASPFLFFTDPPTLRYNALVQGESTHQGPRGSYG